MLNPRRPITRMELLNKVWNTNTNIELVTIDRNVKRIRDAFKREAKRDPIRAVRRVGYVFNDQSLADTRKVDAKRVKLQ
jgi:DNA-binding response OmpR family regulator